MTISSDPTAQERERVLRLPGNILIIEVPDDDDTTTPAGELIDLVFADEIPPAGEQT